MRKVSLVFLFAFLTISAFAQDVIKVNYKGAKPTVTDFAKAGFAYFNADDGEPGDRPWKSVENAMKRRSKGLPQEEGVTLTVDEKNGYILFEQMYDENESYYCRTFAEGRPVYTETHDLLFYRYNNATKRMVSVKLPGFDDKYDNNTYALPRKGKDIVVTKWKDGGTCTQKTLKWTGSGFRK